jgi:hypothetical protein
MNGFERGIHSFETSRWRGYRSSRRLEVTEYLRLSPNQDNLGFSGQLKGISCSQVRAPCRPVIDRHSPLSSEMASKYIPAGSKVDPYSGPGHLGSSPPRLLAKAALTLVDPVEEAEEDSKMSANKVTPAEECALEQNSNAPRPAVPLRKQHRPVLRDR